MKLLYRYEYGRGAFAHAILRRVQRTLYTLEDLFVVPHLRGRGIGTELLNDVLNDADAYEVTLRLRAVPVDGRLAALERLINWYASYGFVRTDTTKTTMIRYPQ